MMFGKNLGAVETAKRIPIGSVGVEIGVWRGDSTALFLERASHVHLVDPWSVTAYEESDEFGDYSAYLKRYSALVGSDDPLKFQQYYDGVYESVRARFTAAQATIHRCTSAQFFGSFSGPVDWVYIDGSHRYEDCLTDLRCASRIVRRGGLIFGDDFVNKPGVTQAVLDFNRMYWVFGGNQYVIQV